MKQKQIGKVIEEFVVFRKSISNMEMYAEDYRSTVVREQGRLAHAFGVQEFLEGKIIELEETAVLREERVALLDANATRYTEMYEETSAKLEETEKVLSDL